MPDPQSSPIDMVASGGALYLADQLGNAIHRYDVASETDQMYANLTLPFAITADEAGHLFVTDTYDSILRIIDLATAEVSSSSFADHPPRLIAAAAGGALYGLVFDASYISGVVSIDASNGASELLTTMSYQPRDMIAGDNGELIFAWQRGLLRFDPTTGEVEEMRFADGDVQ